MLGLYRGDWSLIQKLDSDILILKGRQLLELSLGLS